MLLALLWAAPAAALPFAQRQTPLMKAAVFAAHPAPTCRAPHPFTGSGCLHFRNITQVVQLPRPKATPGSALVRVAAAAVNPCDWEGLYSGRRSASATCIDFSGVVQEAARPCGLAPGTEVWGTWAPGSTAEFVVVDCKHLAAKPSTLSFTEAAAMPVTALTALMALRKMGAPWRDSPAVLVTAGAGGVGVSAIQLAKVMGAGRVVTTCSPRHKALVQRLGADEVIDYHVANWWEVLGKGSLRAVLDILPFSGNGRHALEVLADGGMYVELLQTGLDAGHDKGACEVTRPGNDIDTRYICSSRARPSVQLVDWELHHYGSGDLDYLRNLVEAGQLEPVVDSVHTLENTAEAFEASASQHSTGKVVIKVSDVQ